MPVFIQGNLDYTTPRGECEVMLFAANSTLKTNGELVMGAGTAKAVKDLLPELPAILGQLITDKSLFGVRIVSVRGRAYGAFQSKLDWQKPADLQAIYLAAQQLKQVAEANQQFLFHMPFPGIGNGKLTIPQVAPYLIALPDNVYIYGEYK